MNNGARPTKPDHRDYDYHASFGSLVPPKFPDEYLTDAGFGFPDQNAMELPDGCTDITQAELSTDQTLKKHDPFTLDDFTHANLLGGFDIRTSLDIASKKLRWFAAYFNVRPHQQLDFFDTIRLAMMSGVPEKRSVSIGTPWFKAWQGYTGDVMPMPDTTQRFDVWHNWKVCGWTTINGSSVLIGKSWQGTRVGKGGFQYFPREVVNAIMSVSGTVAFTATQSTPQNIVPINLPYLQYLLSFIRTLIGYAYGRLF